MPPNAHLTEEEKYKWNEIMKYFKKNPEMLIELMPDNVNFSFAPTKKSLSRKGQSMIPDLGVVPPQSGHLDLKKYELDATHKRKKSYGDLRNGSASYYKHHLQPMNPTVGKVAHKDAFNYQSNNTPSEASNNLPIKSQNNYKPGTAAIRLGGEYQAPNFVPSNLVNTVNKTVYKVSSLTVQF